MNLKMVSPLLFALVFIAFALPFFNIMCNDQKLLEISGYDMVFGSASNKESDSKDSTSVPDTEDLSQSFNQDKMKVDTDWRAIAALVCALLGIAFYFMKNLPPIVPSVIADAGLVFLILLMVEISGKADSSQEGVTIAVKTEFGFYFACAAFLAASIVNILVFVQEKKAMASPPPEPPTGI